MLAVFYDVHGNLPALEAVIADARAQGATEFVLGGDYAAFGAYPAQTVAALQALAPVAMIAGNHERWLAGDAHDVPPGNAVIPAAIAFEAEQLPADVRERLTALPPTAEHAGALFCHASPGSDMLGFSPKTDPSDADLLAGDAHERVVFGHTHLQFRRTTPDDVELVNPGSVGIPFDGDPRAAYLLIAPDGMLELRRVAYDAEAYAAALRAVGTPWAEIVADWIDDARP